MTTAVAMINKTGALTRRDPSRMALFKKTVGKDLRGTEIDEAIEWCELYGANPFAKDIYFFVFDADDANKRRVVPVLGIGLYRKIAARSGNYRPDDKPPRFTYDDSLVGPANPKGIVDCEVTVYRYAHGEWFATPSRLRWEERAPIILDGEEGFTWEDIPGQFWPEGHKRAGQPKRRKVPVGEVIAKLDPTKKNWRTMPETMLAKCCEADAIRRGWPNETAGSYAEGELDQAHTIELTATEIIDNAEREDRFERIGGAKAVMVDWMDGEALQRVPAGQFYDKAMAFVRKHMVKGEEEAGHLLAWRSRNAAALQEFWAMEKDAALALKKELEKVEAFHKQPVETEKPKGDKDEGGALL